MKQKMMWTISAIAVLAIGLLLYVNLQNQPKEKLKTEYFIQSTEQPYSEPKETIGSSEPKPEPYLSPVDFETLWMESSDVCAWLDIPGTEISYPILQHPEDDSYYLRRNMKGESDSNGVLFTEASYNSKDFVDPLTIIYGHNMNDGQMFGTLQSTYSSKDSLKEHSEIVIYLPDRELHYTVFAAVPYDNRHILYNYDFTDKRIFRLFFQDILSIRAIQAVYADDAAISSSEKAIILSTCLTGNRNNRFLVCGKLMHTIPADEK